MLDYENCGIGKSNLNKKRTTIFTKCFVDIYDGLKMDENSELEYEVQYTNLDAFEVVTDERVKEIEKQMVDEFHEYLILYFKNGDTATFRNSHADLFIY